MSRALRPAAAQLDLPLVAAVAQAEQPPYRVRLSRRARSLQIEVTPWRGVEVIVPHRTSAKRVQSFVTRNRSWIQRAWAELRALYPGPLGTLVPERIELAALAETWEVRAELGRGVRARVVCDAQIRHLTVAASDHETAALALRGWLRGRAQGVLPDWLGRIAARTGLRYARVQVRSQRSRWGSCSTRGTIALNDKLLFVRPELVEYLMVHELCHTRHFDHSARFWALVAEHLPAGKALDAELDGAWVAVPAWAGE